jgi:hypothetical protein
MFFFNTRPVVPEEETFVMRKNDLITLNIRPSSYLEMGLEFIIYRLSDIRPIKVSGFNSFIHLFCQFIKMNWLMHSEGANAEQNRDSFWKITVITTG